MNAADLPLGIRYGVPSEQYHACTLSVSKSGLDALERSPYHYWATRLDPNRPPAPEPTPAMVLGTMTHCAVLEPGCFDSRYAVAPKCDRRTKDGKAAWAAFVETLAPGQEPADPEMVTQARAMAASVMQIRPVADLLRSGHAEVSAYWIDNDSGVLCRCRPDWVSPAGDGVILFDLKSAIDASPKGFARAVANWNYAKQAAMYSDGWEAATGQHVYGFVFGAVEKDHPFAAAAYMLDDEALEQGRRQYRRNLRTLAECRRADVWPGYTLGDQIQLLQLPRWALEFA